MSDDGASHPAFESVLETVPVGVVLLTADGEITWANDRATELLGLSRGAIDGKRYDDPDWDIWDDDGDPVPSEDHPVSRVVETGETVAGFTHGITLPDGSERWLSSNASPVRDDAGAIERVVVALEDITGPKRLEQLVETFQPVVAALNRASTREDAERTACDRLTASREYGAAWVAGYTPGTTGLDVHADTGLGDAFRDELAALVADPQAESDPVTAAVETGDIQVFAGDNAEPAFECWRDHAQTHGFRGSALAPLAHGGRTFGLLGVYTARVDAFDRRERTLLRTVCDRFGQLLHAFDTEHRLHADTVAELTFRSTDSGSLLVSASGELNCTIDVLDAIPVTEDTVVHYASVRGVSLGGLVELVADDELTGQVRPIREREDPPGGELELELRRASLASVLASSNAVVTRATVTDGQAELVCEVPADEDIESLVARLAESFPETTLAAKREYDRHGESAGQPTDSLLADVYRDDLTDRQRLVLRAAVHGGYFESPRRSTATEIADALSLTQSTVSYHLREAQRTLFERMFERL
jgi:PAS domain S-box-containing protein